MELKFGDPASIKAVQKKRSKVSYAEHLGYYKEPYFCKDCALLKVNSFNSINYYKCGRYKITHGPGTDIRISWPACVFFIKRKEEDF